MTYQPHPAPTASVPGSPQVPVPAGPSEPPAAPSYYGLPPVKHSHYHWKTALSFLAEALGGAPQVVAAAIHFSGGDARTLVRAGRYLALAGAVVSPALLISELHTPRRWFNMLRIFRPTSSMSIGNMSLTAFGVFSFLTAAGQLLEDLGRPSGRLLSNTFSLPAAAAGGMICLYPGTELEKSCVPLWAGSSPLLSPLFAATGMSAGAAALALVAEGLGASERERERLNRLALVAQGAQLAGAILVEKSWRLLGSYRHSRHALAYRFGAVGLGVVFPLAARLARTRGRRMPGGEAATAVATIAGGFLLYHATLEAGNASAGHPDEYLHATRQEPTRRGNPLPGRAAGVGIGFALLAAAGVAFLSRKRRLHR